MTLALALTIEGLALTVTLMTLILALTLALALSVTRRQVRTIGLSNWTRKQLKETLASCRVPPQVLQVELHPLLPQTELRADCAAAGIRVEI